ncbi:unnamed protein product [Cuscuta epithymum]|uniref:Uncharacterized protein n=1 Tax=Cuscuta epithymum TaxID=186058 RepID=A0AAV0DZ04_9ASTE|nr:unnamed protein product [Cuscuta epithymum]
MDDVPELDGEIQQNESDVGSIKAPDVVIEFDSKEAVYVDDEKYQSVLLWLEIQLSTYTPPQVYGSSICDNLTSIPQPSSRV